MLVGEEFEAQSVSVFPATTETAPVRR